jgi:hypothetical protein
MREEEPEDVIIDGGPDRISPGHRLASLLFNRPDIQQQLTITW